jgi:predicted nucleic acid-binding protein
MPKPKLYLDSNVLITAFENAGARSDHAWWLLQAVDAGDVSAATSELSLAEVLVKPLEEGDNELVATYKSTITTSVGFEVATVDRAVLIEAARIRAARRSIRLPDAIHLATATKLDCQFFISGDLRLDMPQGITHLELSPFTLDDVLKD